VVLFVVCIYVGVCLLLIYICRFSVLYVFVMDTFTPYIVPLYASLVLRFLFSVLVQNRGHNS